MAKMTDAVKAMFEQQVAMVATASKQGAPNVGPKGSVLVIDDETLAYAESTGQKTLRNLQENPRIAVMLVDREQHDGYQVKGTAELLTAGELFDKIARRQEARNRPRPRHVVKVRVEEVWSVKGGHTAKRIA